jgi:hypothetical protein
MARSILTTSIIGSWCGLVLAHASTIVLIIITFSWTATIVRRLLDIEQYDRRRSARPSPSLVTRIFFSQILWSGTAVMKLMTGGAWFWQPLAIPYGLVVGAGVAAGIWSLRPFWSQLLEGNGESLEDFDRPTLCCLFFLLSGSPVFAVATMVTLAVLLTQRLHQARFPIVRVNYRAGLPAPSAVLGS